MVIIQKTYCHHFSGSKLPQKMLLAVFTLCLVPEIQIFDHFWLKSAFLGPNFSRTEIFTAKPMVVGCVQHYSTHFVQKNCQKWQKMPILAKSAIFRKKAAL